MIFQSVIRFSNYSIDRYPFRGSTFLCSVIKQWGLTTTALLRVDLGYWEISKTKLFRWNNKWLTAKSRKKPTFKKKNGFWKAETLVTTSIVWGLLTLVNSIWWIQLYDQIWINNNRKLWLITSAILFLPQTRDYKRL